MEIVASLDYMFSKCRTFGLAGFAGIFMVVDAGGEITPSLTDIDCVALTTFDLVHTGFPEEGGGIFDTQKVT